MPRVAVFLPIILTLALTDPAVAGGSTPLLVPPVTAPVAVSFDPPDHPFSSGHRGIDLRAAPGSLVRAAGDGTVTFAGRAGSMIAVTVAHGGGLETTYSALASASVEAGDRVVRGWPLGETDRAHPGGEAGLHFGVRLDGDYVDPLAYLEPVDHGSAFSLVPVAPEGLDDALATYGIGDLTMLSGGCSERSRLERAARPPNDNVLVLVAGIGSRTRGGASSELYARGASDLGYPPGRTYRFSYRGSNGPGLHEPYEGSDTYGDIRVAARRLETLLRRIAVEHPGASVDILAHSQGGLVARTFLQTIAPTTSGLPHVEHFVTLSSPHGGAPLAGAGRDMAGSLGGRLVRRALSGWSRAGGPIPDPHAEAVSQLAPGSELLEDLADGSLPFGTRSLSIAIPNDVVVPADRAELPGGSHAVVPPGGLSGHDRVLTSSSARGLVYRFLGGGAEPCGSGWDRVGPLVGKIVSGLEGSLPRVVGLGLLGL